MLLSDKKHLSGLFISVLIFLHSVGYTQKTTSFSSPECEFQKAEELFKMEQYGSAKETFKLVYDAIDDKYDVRKEQSLYQMGVCAALLFHKDTEFIILSFIKNYPENAKIDQLNFYLANYFFNTQAYDKALKIYNKIESRYLSPENMPEYEFKKGYAHFVAKEYKDAKVLLADVKDKESQYKNKALFYYSHILYIEKSYLSALSGFKSLEKEESYRAIVPFYIAHIHFALEEYEEIIKNTDVLLQTSNKKRIPEINRLIGESYFQLQKYENAIPYFKECFKEIKPTCEDYYSLGYCYFIKKDYDTAINYITHSFCTQDDSLRQYAYFTLGNCYLETNQKELAATMFISAYDLKKNPYLTEDALYTYAKIQYEIASNPFLGSIAAFETFLYEYPKSNRKNEAETYLSNIYLNTKNYKAAIKSIEKIKNKSVTLLTAYQRVLFFYGLNLYNDAKYSNAHTAFDKSIENKYDALIYSQCLFWKGETFYQQRKYPEAINYYELFFASQQASHTPEYLRANYSAGYALFKNKDFSLALKRFLNFEQQIDDITDARMVSDAYNRIGDCYYMASELSKALSYYQKVINMNVYDVDYALFQQAQTEGGLKHPNKKIEILELLIKTYPNSIYATDAELEIGNTYLAMGNSSMAAKIYTSFVEKNPNNQITKEILLKLGSIYYNMEEDDKALETFKQIVADYPRTKEASTALKNIENIYSSSGNIEDFFAYVRNVSFANITEGQQDTLLYNAAADKYFNRQFADAEKGFLSYIQKFPKGMFITHAHFYLGECAMRRSGFDTAFIHYKFVIEHPLDQFEATALQNAAEISCRDSNYKQAIEYYERLSKITPLPSQKADALTGLARTYFAQQDYSKAIEAAQELLKEEKLSPERQEEAHAIIARSYMNTNQLDEAGKEFTVLSKMSKSAYASEALYNLAYIEYKKGDIEKTENKLFEILANISHDYWLAKSYILLGDLYVDKGNTFQARHTYLSIIDNYDGEDLRQIAVDKYNKLLSEEEVKEKQRKEELEEQQEKTNDSLEE